MYTILRLYLSYELFFFFFLPFNFFETTNFLYFLFCFPYPKSVSVLWLCDELPQTRCCFGISTLIQARTSQIKPLPRYTNIRSLWRESQSALLGCRGDGMPCIWLHFFTLCLHLHISFPVCRKTPF